MDHHFSRLCFFRNIAWIFFALPTLLLAVPKQPVTLLLGYERDLQFEPCECSFYPYGGLVREFNLYQSIKKKRGNEKFLPITVGRSLVTATTDLPDVKAAQRMIGGMNLLGTYAFVPGALDLQFKNIELQELIKHAQFPFISANISSSLTIKPFMSFNHQGVEWVLIGLTSPGPVALSEGVMVQPPEAALKKLLESWKDGKKRLLIVLSDLAFFERQALQKKFPEISFWIGGSDVNDRRMPMEQISGRSMFAATGFRAQNSLQVRIEADAKSNLDAIYWSEMVKVAKLNLARNSPQGEWKTALDGVVKTATVKNAVRYTVFDIGVNSKYDRPAMNEMASYLKKTEPKK